jgi:hypothetical protein
MFDCAMKEDNAKSDLIELAVSLERWLLDGACQSDSGAICAWVEYPQRVRAFDYPEISGYWLTYACGRRLWADGIRQRVKRVVQWLQARLSAGNLAGRDGHGAVFHFDLAMIATGLFWAAQRLADEVDESLALKIVDLLADEILRNSRLPALNAASSRATVCSTWAVAGSAHLLKVLQCLLLGHERGHARCLEAAHKLYGNLITLQRANGNFATHQDAHTTFLHPHLYAAEGAWIWGAYWGNSDALWRSQMALDWVWARQLPSGGFPRIWDEEATNAVLVEQSDVLAQAVRLAQIHRRHYPGLSKALTRIRDVCLAQGSARALVYQPNSLAQHQNTWATLFSTQALLLSERDLRWSELI